MTGWIKIKCLYMFCLGEIKLVVDIHSFMVADKGLHGDGFCLRICNDPCSQFLSVFLMVPTYVAVSLYSVGGCICVGWEGGTATDSGHLWMSSVSG